MSIHTRRSVLKGGTALAAGAVLAGSDLLGFARAWAATQPFKPEDGAKLQILRWKRFIQSEEDAFVALVDAYTKATGIEVEFFSESLDDVQPKASVAANVGSGPDLVWGLYSLPHLFPEKCIDVTDVADYLGGKYGGWVPAAETYGTNADGKWIAIPIAFNGNYINYRVSAAKKAGFSEFPTDLEGFAELCKALKANGTPAGFALGHASGDGNAWAHWALWAHGGAMVDENDNVTLDSPEAVAAVDYVKGLYDDFIPGTASWNDGSNNKAFLGGQVALTSNGISIYQKALVDKLEMAADIDHALWPVGPVGIPTEFHIAYPMLAFDYTPYPNAAKSFITFMLEAENFDKWLEGGKAYLTQTLNAYEANPIWTSDPKRTIFRDAAKRTLTAGYRGSVGERAAAALAEYIVLDMFASAATGQQSSADAVKEAARKAARIYR